MKFEASGFSCSLLNLKAWHMEALNVDLCNYDMFGLKVHMPFKI